MRLVELLISFVKIGFTSFGGMSMIPQIHHEMITHGWMTREEVLDIIAMAEITPGPLGLNCATFAGMRAAGVVGALVTNLGVMLPTIVLCTIAAIFIEAFYKSDLLQWIMNGVRPACFGLLTGMLLLLICENVIVNGSVYWQAVAVMAIVSFMLYKFKFSVVKALALSALLGIVIC